MGLSRRALLGLAAGLPFALKQTAEAPKARPPITFKCIPIAYDEDLGYIGNSAPRFYYVPRLYYVRPVWMTPAAELR